MPASAITATSGVLDVGDTWLLGVQVRDDDLAPDLVDADVTATVTLPGGSTVAAVVERDSVGVYLASYALAELGRHTARVVTAGAVVSVVGFAVDAVEATGRPTLADVKTYLGASATQWSDPEIVGALAAETAAQAKACRVTADYPADMGDALMRRVQRNLAMRPMPLAVISNDADDGPTFVPGRDPEVERLEGPYRRFVFA